MRQRLSFASLAKTTTWSVALLILSGCDIPLDPGPDPNPGLRLIEARRVYSLSAAPSTLRAYDVTQNGRQDLVVLSASENTLSILPAVEGGGFGASIDFETGAVPTAFALGDLDQDGFEDVVVANGEAESLSIFYGAFEDFFESRVDLPLLPNTEAVHLILADLNNSGFLDIVVVDQNRQSLQLVYSLGGRSYDGNIAELDTRAQPIHVAAADLFGSGAQDLIVVERGTNSIALYPGNGFGAFLDPIGLETGASPRQATPWDLNGDGILDLLVSCPGSQELAVYLGTGAGFQAPIFTELNFTPSRFTLGAFGPNGGLALATIVFSAGANPELLGQVAVLRSEGDGRFSPPRIWGAGRGAFDVIAADLDNSGRVDLATADNSDRTVSVLLNQGSGRFSTGEHFPVGANPRAALQADFNNDGRADLAVVNLDSRDLRILLGDGQGRFQSLAPIPLPATPRALAAGRINGDNHIDLAISSLNGNVVYILLGRGDGSFQSPRTVNIRSAGESRASQPRSLSLADMNQDGNTDLVVGNAGTDTVAILFGNGDGSFGQPEEFFVGNFPLAVAATDLDGNGAMDVVVINSNDPNVSGGSPGRVSVLLGDGDGGLDRDSRRAVASAGNPLDMVLVDLDGDGDLDAAVVGPGEDRVYIHNGQGAIIAPGNPTRTGVGPNSVTWARFSPLSLPALITSNADDTVSILRNLGGARFAQPLHYPVGRGPLSPVTGDFDGDGIPDLAILLRETGEVAFHRGLRP